MRLGCNRGLLEILRAAAHIDFRHLFVFRQELVHKGLRIVAALHRPGGVALGGGGRVRKVQLHDWAFRVDSGLSPLETGVCQGDCQSRFEALVLRLRKPPSIFLQFCAELL